MKSFTIAAAVAMLAAFATAAPSERRQADAQITFIGAAGAQFAESIPTDGSQFWIYKSLSISKISSASDVSCQFHGIDGSDTTVIGTETVDVGPPQTQVWGSCVALTY